MSGATSIQKWLPPLQPQISDLCVKNKVPLGVPVSWIQKESGGDNTEVTSRDERGFFQLDPRESKDLKLDHQRLTTDPVYSIEAGFVLMNYHRKCVAGYKLPDLDPTSEYAWRLVKFSHCIGAGASKVITLDALKAGMAGNWGTLSMWCGSNVAYYEGKKYSNPVHWCDFINEMFMLGEPYGVSGSGPIVLPPPAV